MYRRDAHRFGMQRVFLCDGHSVGEDHSLDGGAPRLWVFWTMTWTGACQLSSESRWRLHPRLKADAQAMSMM